MSQHIIVDEENDKKFVFGWDQPLMSFYFQGHHPSLDEDDEERIFVWLGTAGSVMYDVEDLLRQARKYGCEIPYETRVKLYGEKDDWI